MSKAEAWLSYLPSYYQEITEMKSIASAKGVELDILAGRLKDMLDQHYPETATWTLSRYEQDLSIPTNLSKPVEQRRSVIISKMRGSGKVSGSMLKNVAQAFERGSIDVTVQPAEYKITIRFMDTLGIPPNLEDLKSAMEDIKPAHLAVEYALRYLTIEEVEDMTILQTESTTQDRFLGGGRV
ncbi:YmfQ family protein [Paenibacillus sp. N3/727]|uniref:YmfQ family protein n=1 Tax=Paenibacillus sp. N3/727 TaxID=2925845 RepID=UPI001F53B48C|nr:YmfQ family protein [Paenibacillus sp. N3/727]UNK17641.1 YmfQ family protein [Paenibacillus sp. N3/727]